MPDKQPQITLEESPVETGLSDAPATKLTESLLNEINLPEDIAKQYRLPQEAEDQDKQTEDQEESLSEEDLELTAEDEPEEDIEEAEESEDEVEEEEPEEDKVEVKHRAAIANMQKRIDKITAQRYEAENKAKELEDRIRELESEPQPVGVQSDDPLSNVNDERTLEDILRKQRKVYDWASRFVYDGTDEEGNPPVMLNAKGEEVEVDLKEVRKYHRIADSILKDYGPKRLEYVRKSAEENKIAKQMFPEFFDESTELGQFYKQAETQYGKYFKGKVPEYKTLLAKAVFGHLTLLKQQQAKKPVTQKAPPPPRTSTAPKKQHKPDKKRIQSDAFDRLAKDPSAFADIMADALS